MDILIQLTLRIIGRRLNTLSWSNREAERFSSKLEGLALTLIDLSTLGVEIGWNGPVEAFSEVEKKNLGSYQERPAEIAEI